MRWARARAFVCVSASERSERRTNSLSTSIFIPFFRCLFIALSIANSNFNCRQSTCRRANREKDRTPREKERLRSDRIEQRKVATVVNIIGIEYSKINNFFCPLLRIYYSFGERIIVMISLIRADSLSAPLWSARRETGINYCLNNDSSWKRTRTPRRSAESDAKWERGNSARDVSLKCIAFESNNSWPAVWLCD